MQSRFKSYSLWKLSFLLGCFALSVSAQELDDLYSPEEIRAIEEEEIQSLLQDSDYNDDTDLPQAVVIAEPTLDSIPNFISELDNYLMSDELVREIEEKYSLRLKEFSFKRSFNEHSRDTVLQRSSKGNTKAEKELYEDMANSVKRHMLLQGIPKYLSARKATRFIGEGYKRAVSLSKKATNFEFKSEKSNWKTGFGINPFNTKAWLKYSNKQSAIELFNYFEKKNTLGILAFTQIGYYQPKSIYNILKNSIEVGFSYSTSPHWEYEYRLEYPINSRSFDAVKNIASLGYRF